MAFVIEIEVGGFGENGPCDVAHIIDDRGRLIGVVKEPLSRDSPGFPEEVFVAQVYKEIFRIFTPPFWVEWDPWSDVAHEVYVIG